MSGAIGWSKTFLCLPWNNNESDGWVGEGESDVRWKTSLGVWVIAEHPIVFVPPIYRYKDRFLNQAASECGWADSLYPSLKRGGVDKKFLSCTSLEVVRISEMSHPCFVRWTQWMNRKRGARSPTTIRKWRPLRWEVTHHLLPLPISVFTFLTSWSLGIL